MVFIVAASIFFFSVEQGSYSQIRTYKITKYVVQGGEQLVDIEFDKLHYYIRKGAHFFEYLVLAFLMSLAVSKSRGGTVKQGIAVLLLCTLFACIDEGIQTFTAGRTGRVKDIFIDGSGIFMGIIVYNFISGVLYKLKHGIDYNKQY
jgi:VanZ family protein